MCKSAHRFLFRKKIVSKHNSGFTLIELLIVIAITAVIGVYTLVNYSSFGEDQNLKSGVLDMQSLLRTAQTNATSSTKCNTNYGTTWQVDFLINKTTINLKCLEAGNYILKRTLQLDEKDSNIFIQLVSGTGTSCPVALPFSVRFSFPGNKINFIAADGSPLTNCTSATVTLKNSRTSDTKLLTIEQGGRVYAP